MSLELFNEQKAILDKIQQSQMMESMGGGNMGAQPVMHSFWAPSILQLNKPILP